jgi:hypothetical protein
MIWKESGGVSNDEWGLVVVGFGWGDVSQCDVSNETVEVGVEMYRVTQVTSRLSVSNLKQRILVGSRKIGRYCSGRVYWHGILAMHHSNHARRGVW